MRAIILAAGAGTRLRGIDVARPKCVVPFEGTPLIRLQLDTLRWSGIEDITVVVGFDGDGVRRACGAGVAFIENPIFAETNSLYSLWLARPLLQEAFVVLNCDVLFHPTMLGDLLTARHENALLVSYPQPGDPELGDEEMKVSVRQGRVVDIRKDLPADEVDAENVGIARFSDAGAARLSLVLDRLIASGHGREWAPAAFRELTRHDPVYAVGTRGLPWIEIDTPEDYARAVAVIFPAIRDAVAGCAPAIRRRA